MIDILVITGKSCSGKDTIAHELQNNYGFNRIITYTTRGKREGEVDGVTYHFISTEEFLQKYNEGFFLEIKHYDTVEGIWYYGSSIESYQNADDKSMCILTPSGLQKLVENNIKYIGFLIDVSDETIKERQINRGDNSLEAERRFNADKLDFRDVYDLVDYVIDNDGRDVSDVAEDINILYTEF